MVRDPRVPHLRTTPFPTRRSSDLPPEAMIKWTTSNPAKGVGLDKRIGTIAPGYQADVVLWSGDPFSVYSRADLVLIDGAVAWDRARPPSRPVSDFELGRGGVEP